MFRVPSATSSAVSRGCIAGLLALTLNTLPAGAQTEPVVRSPEPPAQPASSVRATPPTTLRHVREWVDYRMAGHLSSLPNEARLFYRRGLMAKQAGQQDEALGDVRGAADLDPSFVDPHLTLAAWMLVREPSQALQQYATVVELLRENFNLQLGLAANALILALQALFVGLLFAGLVIVVSLQDELTHAWREQTSRFATLQGARVWGWAFLALPLVAGFGLTLPTLGFLGYLWPALRARERILFVMLFAFSFSIPFGLTAIERLSLPMRPDAGPLYGVPTIENEPYSPASEARLQAVAATETDNPLVHFGLGWVARRGSDLVESEKSYRRVLTLWPNDDRTLNNLGNVLAMQGRTEDALVFYQRAVSANPANAAAYYNASQLHTQRYEYQAATEALTRATALNFEMVKSFQQQATADGLLPLVDQWMTPSVFWKALGHARVPGDLAGSIPTSLRRHMETTGWRFSLLALLFAGGGIAAGLAQQRRLPLRNCSNCGRVVCRRCAERRRENALCPECGLIESRAETADFSRLLLMQYRKRGLRNRQLIRTALASVVPGYGLLAHRRVFTAVLLCAYSWLLAGAWLGWPPPFTIEPRLTLSGQELPLVMFLVCVLAVYAISLLGYAQLTSREREREAALQSSQRGRITQSTRRASALAA